MANPYQYPRLKVTSPKAHVLHCELNRESKMNAFDMQMWDDIRHFFAAVASDVNCRAVLLSGAGRAFTAGLDLSEPANMIPSNDELDAARRGLDIRSVGKQWQASFNNIETCGKAVVVCVHGACVGAGLEMISACDVRFCSADAFFELAEVDVALASDVGGLQRFPRIVGNDSLVRELALSARRFNSQEALQMGLVSRVCSSHGDMLTEALLLCEKIASKSPVATLGVKTLLNYSRDHTVHDSLEYALTWNQSAIQTQDMMKAAMAKMSKQLAEYENLPPSKAKL